MSSEQKIPEWAEKAAQDFHDKWETGMSGAAFRDLIRALLAAEQRGLEKAAAHCDAAAAGRYNQSADAKEHRAHSAARDFESMAMQSVQNAAAIRSLGEQQ